ncbi:MAG: prepilin-type N-terminal cleavage/methylation domain-containing protein [bacterium]|nr:prepilin-type N-terminal cleavage/methylation domain-containing protein [bacterium]
MYENPLSNQRGFTLVEIVIVILIIGLLAGVATMKMNESIETARYEQTKNELDQLARAMAGNPEVYAEGARSDFGYVGDVGGLPPNLDALVLNPGGYTTWDGPYIGAGINGDDFKKDAWGAVYAYSGSSMRSTGSGMNIDKVFATSSGALLSNRVEGVVRDANLTMPGTAFTATMQLQLVYPDGTGSMTIATTNPDLYGKFSFAGVPIGGHWLRAIYTPASDTTAFPVTVYPNRDVKLDIIFPADLW